MYSRALVFAVLCTASSALAQGQNATLLGTWNQAGTTYNDVWGYTAPNGKEYALLGRRDGTSVIDVSNPQSPVERGFFSGPNSTWRDIRTYQNYAYVVTEAAGGMQIIDLTNPDNPQFVTTWGTSRWGNAHNICIDTATGWIYVPGTGNGCAVMDASTNPTNPTFIGYYGSGAQSGYIHDMHVQNGLGHLAMIYNGFLRVVDVTGWPFSTLSEANTPGAFAHNAWPNASDTLVVTTDEVTGGVVQFFDISNPAAPIARGSFTPNPASIPHNAYMVGDICHVSWYTEGWRAIDVSDPNNPVEVAYYDTWPGSSGGYNGAWGCYPFLPSGNILINDISTGLYVVQPNISSITLNHTPLTDTGDELGPYPVTTTASSPAGLTAVDLFWSTDGNNFTPVAMTATGQPDEYRADIPGQTAPTIVSYYIEARDGSGTRRSPALGAHSFLIGSRIPVHFDDFEGASTWTHGQVQTQDDWQLGAPAGQSGTAGGGWSDPNRAFSGVNVWANDLGGSGFNGAYQSNVSNWLQSPAIPTGSAQGLRLRFQRWLTVEDANADQARLLVNGQQVWQNPAGSNTLDTDWTEVEYDLSAITNSASTVTIRFELITNGSQNFGGWAIDDVELFALGDCVPPQIYGAGTAGAGGTVPQIGLTGDPRIGQSFQVTGGGMLGGAGVFLVTGFRDTNQPLYGITALVDPSLATFLFHTASGPTGLPGVGAAAQTYFVPNSAVLDNMDLFNQWVVLDPSSPGGTFAASPGMRFRVCRN